MTDDTPPDSRLDSAEETPDSPPEGVREWLTWLRRTDHGAVAFVFRNHIEGALPPTGEVG